MFSEVMVPFVSDRERNGVEWKGEKSLGVRSKRTSAKILGYWTLHLIQIWP